MQEPWAKRASGYVHRPLLAVLTASWTIFAWSALFQRLDTARTFRRWEPGTTVEALWLGLSPVVLGLALLLAWRRRARWQPRLTAILDRHTAAVDAVPVRALPAWITLAAGTGLFLELALIRVHASYFQLFAYFKNVSLLSCFLGLGIGYALGRARRIATPLVVPLLAGQVALLFILRFQGVGRLLQNPISEQVTLGMGQTTDLAHVLIVYGFLVFFFTLNTLAFIPLGQVASRLMTGMAPLRSYSWNLAGSLAGIGVFTLASMAWTPPSVWLAAGTVGILYLLRGGTSAFLPSAVAAVGLLALLALPLAPTQVDVYSPYQILSVVSQRGQPPTVNVNNVYFQKILDLREAAAAEDEQSRIWAGHYELPYLFRPDPEAVLVVGAGTGNDVAAALRANATAVDAVEIDPAIQRLGKELHPERPYQSPRVTAIVADARSFIRHAEDRYDLVVYGLLDSHTLLSGHGGVRLDSYVYTVEAFREARDRLTDEGVLCLSFAVMNHRLGRKLYLMLQEAFDGRAPRVFRTRHDAGFAFVTGPGLGDPTVDVSARLDDVTAQFEDPRYDVDLSTDDWPFFYMPRRTYPVTYLTMIGVLVLLSLLFVRSFLTGGGSGQTGFSLPCFFLGAGFMLVETKGITELALVYGSTWVVVSVVVAAILVMAFLANVLIIRIGPPPRTVTYPLLLASVGAGLVASRTGGMFLPAVVEGPALTALLTLPLFFSGFAFSTELERSSSVAVALSSNLIGAMLGGFLEYNAMYFGFGSLYWVALAMYGLAWGTSQYGVVAVGTEAGPAPAAARV